MSTVRQQVAADDERARPKMFDGRDRISEKSPAISELLTRTGTQLRKRALFRYIRYIRYIRYVAFKTVVLLHREHYLLNDGGRARELTFTRTWHTFSLHAHHLARVHHAPYGIEPLLPPPLPPRLCKSLAVHLLRSLLSLLRPCLMPTLHQTRPPLPA